ncbi:c-type cytochrome [Zoogloea sp.]|uniref:c-type cytochrome n=1 Tax=Zoogloea sp. TaxID=49181 RepID=UPI0026076B64|nr:c-type cytochrome [Zoogloea sp.]MDD3354250.1 c-type cytochrome [Zoogloea sp.]
MNALRKTALLAGLTLMASTASAGVDEDMKGLASKSGCFTCHSIEAGAKGPNGMAPIGPAWQDVARMYKGKPGADTFLTRVVLEGSNPYGSHWKDKVSGLAMPPNNVAIKEADALKLVRWILAMAK